MDSTVHGILQARILEWVACSLLQGIFPTQGSNPGLLHCRRILYQLSHQGSPRILEWVAYPFSSGSSWPRNWSGVSCIAGGFFTSWAANKAQRLVKLTVITKSSNDLRGKWVAKKESHWPRVWINEDCILSYEGTDSVSNLNSHSVFCLVTHMANWLLTLDSNTKTKEVNQFLDEILPVPLSFRVTAVPLCNDHWAKTETAAFGVCGRRFRHVVYVLGWGANGHKTIV